MNKKMLYAVAIGASVYSAATAQNAIISNPEKDSSDVLQTISITAIRKIGIPFTEISKQEIQQSNKVQDMPYLLQNTPSVVVTSDAGTGIGYTGMRIRGIDQTRINVTINGVPVNDPESGGVFWVDMPDLASSTQSIQIQRGTGTSTNGSGAFGANINVQTNAIRATPYVESYNYAGSFGTLKNTLQLGTGLIDNHFSFDARISRLQSNGYVDRASASLNSYFLSGNYSNGKTSVTFTAFQGKEKTYQSWNGVAQDSLLTNRTMNVYTYDNQVDDYAQAYQQLHIIHSFTPKYSTKSYSLFAYTTLFHTKGKGYYEEYKENQYLPDYKIAADSVGNTLIENSNLIRRKWLDNDYWGINNSVRYIKNKHQIWLGLNYYLYQGKHYGEVIWSQYANNSSIRHPYYADSATKKESNNYVKYMYSINDKVVVYTDLQLRGVNYSFLGYDAQNLSSYQKVNYLFFNPKLALTYAINATHSLQLQTGIANREPIRQDLINSTPTSRPKAEKLYDLELGYSLHWRKKLVLHTTFYSMDYKDQLVLTGQINDVGAYTRTNVKNSHRRGIEIDAKYSISNKWQLASTVSLSSNKIQKFREYVDDYDLGTQKINDYTTTNIAFSPSIISYLGITYQPMVNFSIQLQNRYVGKQYLDNTNNVNRMLASYYTADLHVHYDVAISKKYPIQLRASILNITNAKYANNGYTFSYILGQKQTTQNYYYPQATTSFLVGINVLLN